MEFSFTNQFSELENILHMIGIIIQRIPVLLLHSSTLKNVYELFNLIWFYLFNLKTIIWSVAIGQKSIHLYFHIEVYATNTLQGTDMQKFGNSDQTSVTKLIKICLCSMVIKTWTVTADTPTVRSLLQTYKSFKLYLEMLRIRRSWEKERQYKHGC